MYSKLISYFPNLSTKMELDESTPTSVPNSFVQNIIAEHSGSLKNAVISMIREFLKCLQIQQLMIYKLFTTFVRSDF